MLIVIFCFAFSNQFCRTIAGGGEHVDIHGIRYRSDPLEGKSGVSSDYGKRYLIGRVPQHDLPLYQTERYSTSNFHYTINIKDDGNYVLVLKFSEVYFDSPNKKVVSTIVRPLILFAEFFGYLDIQRPYQRPARCRIWFGYFCQSWSSHCPRRSYSIRHTKGSTTNLRPSLAIRWQITHTTDKST